MPIVDTPTWRPSETTSHRVAGRVAAESTGAIVIPFPRSRLARGRLAAPTPHPDRRVPPGAGHGQLRLTRRGRVVVALAAIAVAAAGMWGMARVIAPSTVAEPVVVEVRPGDTLWQIARQVAPGADTRDVVARVKRDNDLSDGVLHAGQRLVVYP